MPPLSLTTLLKRRDALNAEIAAAEAKAKADEHRRQTEPVAARILGRIILDTEPSREPVVVRLQAALNNGQGRRSDLPAWELLAETYKLDLPATLTDPIPRQPKSDIAGTADIDPAEHAPASSDNGKEIEAQAVPEVTDA